jgi:hypothetical protein
VATIIAGLVLSKYNKCKWLFISKEKTLNYEEYPRSRRLTAAEHIKDYGAIAGTEVHKLPV